MRLEVKLEAKQHEYQILFYEGFWGDQAHLHSALSPYGKKIAIITDESVANLYAKNIEFALCHAGFESFVFTFPPGEQNKTRENKAAIEDAMLQKGLGRDIAVLALGGGVVLDLAGYIAATYGRGVPLIMMPTTLLGMVDASLGGKNGVNTLYGKNLIGTVYQPRKVIIDIAFLRSLPSSEIRNGWSEMIKHALIADRAYFDFMFEHCDPLCSLETSQIVPAIHKSCEIKMQIVMQDEHDAGMRNLLNFGHTIGHALEKSSEYTLSHGEAVAIGLAVESYISMLQGKLKAEAFERLLAIISKYRMPLRLPAGITAGAIKKAMAMDKKSLCGQPRFVIIQEIGKTECFDGCYCAPVQEKVIDEAIEWMLYDLCCH